jgi:hypothetical protein
LIESIKQSFSKDQEKSFSKDQEKSYILLPFEVSEPVERIDIECFYDSFSTSSSGAFTLEKDRAVIDLAVSDPSGNLAGAAGSDRKKVWLSPLGSAPGFSEAPIAQGTWNIIAGLYHIPEKGAKVSYNITLSKKKRRLFKGDTHVHTTASDGVKSVPQIISEAREQKLDFVILTDHNNFHPNLGVPASDLTVIPGTEWTHYKGHAGFLGAQRPFKGSYCSKDALEVKAVFEEAKSNGAYVVLNHPFCHLVPWEWGFDLPFDGVEIWNGVMSERNMKAVAWWHSELSQGFKIPVCGGSDYHRSSLLSALGTPTMCLYAMSRAPSDIMDALKKGAGYISFEPSGPGVDAASLQSGASFGEAANYGEEVKFEFADLKGADVVRLVTDTESLQFVCPQDATAFEVSKAFPGAKFVRAEVHRIYAPGLPPMAALISNPIYFAAFQ